MELFPESRTLGASSGSLKPVSPRTFRRTPIGRPPKLVIFVLITSVLLTFAGVRLSAPFILRQKVAAAFQQIPGYTAAFGAARLDFFRKGFTLTDVALVPDHPEQLPVVRVDKVQFEGRWTGSGASLGGIRADGTEIIVPLPELLKHPGSLQRFQPFVARLWPFPWTDATVQKGRLVLRGAVPSDTIVVEDVTFRLQRSPAVLDAIGRLPEGGSVAVRIESDPKKPDRLSILFDINDLKLAAYRQRLARMARIHVASGQFSVRVQGRYENGTFTGTALPRLAGVPALRAARTRAVKPTFGQALASAFGSLFKKKKDNRNLYRLPLKPERVPLMFRNPHAGPWRGVPYIMNEAVSRSLRAGLQDRRHIAVARRESRHS
jgi:hypothetical protein